ncbi:hypothetical protein E4T42_05860 [Aureobasidium subglaciale]|nr:hypothetical protein E4T42_05860 [Aureobasidium subglaciale]
MSHRGNFRPGYSTGGYGVNRGIGGSSGFQPINDRNPEPYPPRHSSNGFNNGFINGHNNGFSNGHNNVHSNGYSNGYNNGFNNTMSYAYRPFAGQNSFQGNPGSSSAREAHDALKLEERTKKADERAEKKRLKQSGDLVLPITNRHLDRDMRKAFVPLAQEARDNLARISREARAEYGDSEEKKLKHLERAVETLSAVAYRHYIHILGVDKCMQQQLSHLEREEDPSTLPEYARVDLGSGRDKKKPGNHFRKGKQSSKTT